LLTPKKTDREGEKWSSKASITGGEGLTEHQGGTNERKKEAELRGRERLLTCFNHDSWAAGQSPAVLALRP